MEKEFDKNQVVEETVKVITEAIDQNRKEE